jgi:hypothetical protein
VDYDVCLSFADEDRGYVGAVAEALRRRAVRVFYDAHAQADLWGKDLYVHFDYVYRKAARYCVVFGSQHYVRKYWTKHELGSAQSRALMNAEEYLLPARLDDTEIPGIRPTVSFVDLRGMSPEAFADLICDKLQRSSLDSGHGVDRTHVIDWRKPLEVDVAGSRDLIACYQAIPISDEMTRIAEVVSDSVRLVGEQARTEDDNVYWTHREDRYFDRLYATASVLMSLRMLGIPANCELIRRATNYLRCSAPSIDNRAATMFLLITDQLPEADLVEFLDRLAEHQAPSGDSAIAGSFLLPQGPSPAEARPNWSESPLHADGASFHACHIADVLLHISADRAVARSRAEPVLAGIRRYLVRALNQHDGWLVDMAGRRAPITLFAYAVCPALSIPLPANWRQVAAEVFSMFPAGQYGQLTRYFAVMNAWYVYAVTQDVEFGAEARQFAVEFLSKLPSLGSGEGWTARDLAALQHALTCAARMADPRLVRFIDSAAVAAIGGVERRIGLAG